MDKDIPYTYRLQRVKEKITFEGGYIIAGLMVIDVAQLIQEFKAAQGPMRGQ